MNAWDEPSGCVGILWAVVAGALIIAGIVLWVVR